MLPDGWKLTNTGQECFSIVPGRNKPKEFSGSIPWITTPEISGRYLPSHLQKNYISKHTIKESGAKIVPEGGVVMSAVGDLGLVAIATEEITLNQQLHAFICKKNIDNEFLAYSIETQKSFMERVASKTTIPYLNKANCESIPILLPPLPEQKKIAAILSTWDRAIEGTEKLLANSQQQKKALMQQLLTGKKRLPGFSGEWETLPFKKTAQLTKGSQLNRLDCVSDGTFPVINGGITPSGYTNEANRPAGTITISEGGNSCGYVDYQKEKFWCGGHCYSVEQSKIFIEFLYQTLKFSQPTIMKLRVGSGLPNIQKKSLESLQIHHPIDTNEQKAIAAVLSTADEEITSLESDLLRLRQEKKALMQQLLTGKRRVTVD